LLSRHRASTMDGAMVVGRAAGLLALPGAAHGPCFLSPEGDDGDPRPVYPVASVQGAVIRAPSNPGYYRLRMPDGRTLRLALAPSGTSGMYRLLATRRARMWGVMAQVYSLRLAASDPVSGTWGHGDLA